MYAGTHLTDLGRKEGHTDIQPSARPGIEPGTYGLGGRDLTTVPTPPLGKTITARSARIIQNNARTVIIASPRYRENSPFEKYFAECMNERASELCRCSIDFRIYSSLETRIIMIISCLGNCIAQGGGGGGGFDLLRVGVSQIRTKCKVCQLLLQVILLQVSSKN